MENEHGTYLMAPVIRDPTAKSAGAWRPSLNMIRLIADLNGPGAELRVMEMLASQFDEFERDLITLSREMGVPIWPFKQPGVITPTDMMDMDRLPMKCWRPDCTGVHDNNRYSELCPAALDRKRAKDLKYQHSVKGVLTRLAAQSAGREEALAYAEAQFRGICEDLGISAKI